MKKEDVAFLNQLVKSLEESEAELEEYYRRGNYEGFVKMKRFILKIQKKIAEVANDI